MKKKIFGGVVVLALTAIAVFNVNVNTKEDIRRLSLSNIEALAQESGQEVVITCGAYEGPCCRFCYSSGLYFNCDFTGTELARDPSAWLDNRYSKLIWFQ